MELFGIDENPVPPGGVVGTAVASDGVKLRYARWRMTGRRSQGTVCLLQGRGENIEKYFETIGDLRKRGFTVATLDWRGQGASDRRLRNRRKGHIDGFGEYERDLEAFMQQVVLPDCPPPHFALAHSTGALVCLRAAREGVARFARAVLVAPLMGLGPTRTSQPTAFRIAAFMTATGLGEVTVPPNELARPLEELAFEGNMLTGDPVRFARNVAIARQLQDLAVGSPTFGWLYAACRAMREANDPDFAPAIRLPALIVAGGLDRVISLTAAEALASGLRAGGQVIIPGGRHEILMERDAVRQQFWAAFDAFVPGTG
jgi:lysophospholipase